LLANSASAADDKQSSVEGSDKQMVEKTGCGYPDRVRDGLHPVQYFCLANVYLKALRFDMATICLEKLKKSIPKDEANKFANRLERSYMPKHPVPDKAVERLKELAIWGGDENSKRRKEFQEVISEFPGFECPYFFIQADWNNGNPDRRIEIQAMESVLSINPDNIDALVRLMELHSKEPETHRKYALRVSELDPDRIVDFDRIERTLLTKRKKEEKIQQSPKPVKKKRVRILLGK